MNRHELQHVDETDAFYDNHMLYRMLKVKRSATREQIIFALHRQSYFKTILLKQHQKKIDDVQQQLDQIMQKNQREVVHLTELYDRSKDILLNKTARDMYNVYGDSGTAFGPPRPRIPDTYAVRRPDARRQESIPPPEMPDTILAQHHSRP